MYKPFRLRTEIEKENARNRQRRYRSKNLEKCREQGKLLKRKQRQSNPDKFREYNRKYRKENKEKFKLYYLKRKDKLKIYRNICRLRKYGLTQQTFDSLLESQEGKCAICKQELKNDINIDHCHSKSHGITRKILCSPCNLYLGYVENKFLDGIDIQERVTEYLKTHKCWGKH
jgi:hypothetical protein